MMRLRALTINAAVLGISATLATAQTNVPKKRTIWIPPPMGSHLGGGFVDPGETDNRSTTNLGTFQENTKLGTAVANFDAKSAKTVEGWALIAAAVSWQTKVPVEILKKQRAGTGLTYGQLLVANSLASGSAKSFDQILVLRAKSRNWSQLAKKLHIGIGSIVARLKAADESVQYAEARRKLRREQNFRETDFQRDGRARDPRQG
jgi:hypothetical protein